MLLFLACNSSTQQDRINKSPSQLEVEVSVDNKKPNTLPTEAPKSQTSAISIPEGFFKFEELFGDLNKDGIKDRIVIVKGTDTTKVVEDDYRGRLDRNRRGIMVFSDQDGTWELVLKNLDCFSSENEEGGIYYAPILSMEIENGNLYIHYHHGRYGFWKYTFRKNKDDFELIGYDGSSNYGPIVQQETSINFLTNKKLIRVNENENAEEGGQEVFVETWHDLKQKSILKLSEIVDFDELRLETEE